MKKFCCAAIVFSFLILQAIIALSQTNNLYIYGNNTEDTKAHVVEQRGSYYLVGKYGAYNHDILLSKLSNFSVEWSKTFDQGSAEDGYNLVADEDNNLFLSAAGNGNSSTIFLKLSENGTPLISQKIGSFHDRIKFLTPLKDGTLLFYGELEGAISGHNQLALYKTDKDLNPIWERVLSHHNSSDDKSGMEVYSREILELNDGSLVLLASYSAYNDAQNNRSLRLLKLATDGSLQWVKGFSNIRADNPQAISADYANGFIICGSSNGYSEGGSTDMQIVKVDGEGNIEWARVIGGSNEEVAYKIIKTPDNGYLVGGVTNSFGKGQNDLLLLKLNQQGALQWAKTFGGIGEEAITNLFSLGDKIVLSGYSNSFNSQTYQTFLYEIYDSNQLEASCFEDVTTGLKVENIQLSTFNTMYNITGFNTPGGVELAVNAPNISMEEKCLSCYEDEEYDLEVCPGAGETLTLDASDANATAYLWENGSTITSKTVSSPGVYNVVVYYDFCKINKIFNVAVKGSEEVKLGPDISSCEGGVVSLRAPENLPAGSFAWNNGSIARTIAVNSSGTYWLTYESPCGPITDTVSVKISAPPAVNLGGDLTICKDERLQLTADFTGGTIAWSDSTESHTFEITGPGKYWATVENECGLATDTVYVKNKVLESPFMPNVITPNQDSFNDKFIIDEQLIGASLSVYSRWGRLVYYSPAYDNSWGGEGLSKGVYYIRLHEPCSGNYFNQEVAILD
jgi:hypothetical protein